MITAHLILYVIAIVFAALAAIQVSSPPWFKIHWGWAAIMVWLLAGLV